MNRKNKENLQISFTLAILLWAFILWGLGWEYLMPTAAVVLIWSIYAFSLYLFAPVKFAYSIAGISWISSWLFAVFLPEPWNHCMGVTLSGVLIGSHLCMVYRERKKAAEKSESQPVRKKNHSSDVLEIKDSTGKPVTVNFREETRKAWFGKTYRACFVKFTMGENWVEFEPGDFDWEALNQGQMIESLTCSKGAVLVSNTRFAEPFTIFGQVTEGLPENSWVFIFTLLEEDEQMQAVFEDQVFQELVADILAHAV